MIGLMITVIVLMVIVVVLFTFWCVDREVIAQLRRDDNRDKRDLREAFRESLHENGALREENARLVEENLNLSTQLQNFHSCLVSFGPKNYSVLVRGMAEYKAKFNQERNEV